MYRIPSDLTNLAQPFKCVRSTRLMKHVIDLQGLHKGRKLHFNARSEDIPLTGAYRSYHPFLTKSFVLTLLIKHAKSCSSLSARDANKPFPNKWTSTAGSDLGLSLCCFSKGNPVKESHKKLERAVPTVAPRSHRQLAAKAEFWIVVGSQTQ